MISAVSAVGLIIQAALATVAWILQVQAECNLVAFHNISLPLMINRHTTQQDLVIENVLCVVVFLWNGQCAAC